MAKFECITGKTYEIPDNSCLLCEHCTDIFVDFTNGPYLIICDKHTDISNGINGKCKDFKEVKEC